MSALQRLRGEPRFSLLFCGQTLTFYRQGVPIGATTGFMTFVLFNLPWHVIPTAGAVLQLLTTAAGCYAACTLMASRTPATLPADAAAARWL